MYRQDEQTIRPESSCITGSATRFDDEPPWTEDDILRLHGLLLEKSLHDLFDLRVSAATRADILEWMQATKERSNAFSYRACCRLFGLDAEEIRDRVLQRYRQRHTH